MTAKLNVPSVGRLRHSAIRIMACPSFASCYQERMRL